MPLTVVDKINYKKQTYELRGDRGYKSFFLDRRTDGFLNNKNTYALTDHDGGFSVYLLKPPIPEELIRVVTLWLQNDLGLDLQEFLDSVLGC